MVEFIRAAVLSNRDPSQPSSQDLSPRNQQVAASDGNRRAIESPLSAVRDALRRVGPHSITQTTRMTLNSGVMELEGRVASYYHRQLIIETCRRVCPELRIVDRVSVVKPERWFNVSADPGPSTES